MTILNLSILYHIKVYELHILDFQNCYLITQGSPLFSAPPVKELFKPVKQSRMTRNHVCTTWNRNLAHSGQLQRPLNGWNNSMRTGVNFFALFPRYFRASSLCLHELSLQKSAVFSQFFASHGCAAFEELYCRGFSRCLKHILKHF